MKMQISDMLGQYNRNVTNGTEELQGAQGAQKMVSTVGELSAGSIFEGTVNAVRGNKVILALGNGQIMAAKLDGKVDIKPGSAMFFQVKSNDGVTVAIRPYTTSGSQANPVLLNALTAAGIPVTERNITMVDAMMKEQLPISRQSILDMVKVISGNPQIDVRTIVQMTKLGFPVTDEMAAQFENYMTDRHSILGELDTVIGRLMDVLGDENLPSANALSLYKQLLHVLGGDADPGLAGKNGTEMEMLLDAESLPDGENVRVESEADRIQMPQGEEAPSGVKQEVQKGFLADFGIESETRGLFGAQAGHTMQTDIEGDAMLSDLLNEEQLVKLTKQLCDIPVFVGNEVLFSGANEGEVFVNTIEEFTDTELLEQGQTQAEEAVLKKEITVGKLLDTVRIALSENSSLGLDGMQKLFAGKEFRTLLKHAIQQQWLMEPKELKEEEKVSTLYKKMERQINDIEGAMRMAGISQESFSKAAADVRGNIEFMNQMNQIYTYIQMPLKMTGQNANGELYVYTNKKQILDPDAELSAFLHLDLENLGSTDVSVKMKNRNVQTNFYFKEDATYHLLEKHLPVLEKRLEKKGYNCTITITNEEKSTRPMEDFLKKDKSLGKSLHRYSFDVRA